MKLLEKVKTVTGSLLRLRGRKHGNKKMEIRQYSSNIMNKFDLEFLQNFMGFGNRKVKFLGHELGS